MGVSASKNTVVRQLFDRESCTYTYLVWDDATKDAVLIDPVIELVERDLGLIDELGLSLKYAMNTHVHADHITGSGKIKTARTGVSSVLGEVGNEQAKADIKLKDGDEIRLGPNTVLKAMHTPGHTSGCHSYVLNDDQAVFTGDWVLVRGCGRTDFQQGDSRLMYKGVHSKLFTMPDSTIVYPAHDYKGRTKSTVGEEKKFNPRLTKTEDEFVDLMANLNLAYPAKIDASLPANLVCGL